VTSKGDAAPGSLRGVDPFRCIAAKRHVPKPLDRVSVSCEMRWAARPALAEPICRACGSFALIA
jgi:hypothetical protein